MSSRRLFNVRRATAADETNIRALQDAALRIEAGENGQGEEIASLISHIGTLDPVSLADGTHFVATVEGDIIASGGWSARPAAYDAYLRSGAPAAAGSAVIHGVYVDPVFAASGIARRILAAIEDDIARAGHCEASVATPYDAMPFYTASGYRPSQLVSLAFPDGTEIHGVRMAKAIPTAMAIAA